MQMKQQGDNLQADTRGNDQKKQIQKGKVGKSVCR